MNLRALGFLSFQSFKGMLTGRSESRQLLGSILGMSLGLIPLLVVLVVADGMISGITARYLETSTYHLQVQSYNGGNRDELNAAADKIRQIPGVKSLHWERSGPGLGYSADNRTGIHLRGLEASTLQNDPGFQQYLKFTSGSADFGGKDGALLGSEIAKKLGVRVGDEFKILTARSVPGSHILPRITTFKVRGIFSCGYQDLDKLWVIIPLEQAEKLLVGDEYRTVLGLKVDKPFGELEPLVQSLRQELPFGYKVYTWYELGRAQYKNFQATKTLLLFIMLMILIVSAVNISSAMVMIVLEKQKDIAILKALGASPGNISLIYTLMGFFCGVIGTTLGVGLGLVAAIHVNELIAALDLMLSALTGFAGQITGSGAPPVKLLNAAYYLEKIPIQIDVATVILVSIFSVLLATLAAWLPARGAGKLRPLEVLRKF